MPKAVVNGSRFARFFGGRFQVQEDGSVVVRLSLTREHEGPPGYAHGGALSTLLDEAMGAAVWYAGYAVLAVHLEIDFRRPVPLETPVQVQGQVTRREGRKAFTTGAISLPDGTLAVSGSGIFVDAPQVLPETMPGFSFSPPTDE